MSAGQGTKVHQVFSFLAPVSPQTFLAKYWTPGTSTGRSFSRSAGLGRLLEAFSPSSRGAGSAASEDPSAALVSCRIHRLPRPTGRVDVGLVAEGDGRGYSSTVLKPWLCASDCTARHLSVI